MAVMPRLFPYNACLHLILPAAVLGKAWQSFQRAIASLIVGSEKCEVFKCPFCETDHQAHVKKCEPNRSRIILDIWRNYGRRHGNGLLNEQIFHRDSVLRLDADTLSQRDVRAAFDSTTGVSEH